MRIKNSYFDFEFQKIIYHTHSNFEEKAPPTDIALTQYYTMDDFKFFKIFVITSNSRGSGTNANVILLFLIHSRIQVQIIYLKTILAYKKKHI